MKIEWNKVTWYSKLIALALFIALPFLGFYLGMRYEELRQEVNSVPALPSPQPAQRCGGNMRNAPTCDGGYHCAPEPGSHLPFGDVGGVCVPD